MNKLEKLRSKAKKALPYLKEIVKAYSSDFRPQKNRLKVINMLANDICNSKCTMCHIWKQKLDYELTPEQLSGLLKDPLFKSVTGVGITGGEPTLRSDLVDLYKACCESLPQLKGMSIITNAIKEKDVISQIDKVNELLISYGKSFSVMVSLDGYGEVHDLHRGRPGNFLSALKVIDHVRYNTMLPLSIGCTITKSNVYDVDELLDWMIAEGLYGRFRVGEFITRLYNDGLVEEIRNFDDDEAYHLSCFIHRVKTEFEMNPFFKRTYDSILSVLNGGLRTSGCPYQSEGVVVDSKGKLLYCAPKSKVLGSAVERSGFDIYNENLEELKRIKSSHCDTCIHDYHAQPTKEEYAKILNRFKWQFLLDLKFSSYIVPLLHSKRISQNKERRKILIVGWYGTETVGDKAILGAIVDHYLNVEQKPEFIIASLFPFVTERTIKELGIQAKVIPFYSRSFVNHAANSDVVVMGGGPLMQMDALNIPLNAFKIAKKFGRKTVTFGCGIGPLYNKKYENIVQRILKLSDEIRLRDTKSVQIAEKYVPKKTVELFGDPARSYVKSVGEKIVVEKKERVLCCFLREWSYEYARSFSMDEFLIMRGQFEKKLADAIKEICRKQNLFPKFYSMHTFHVGGDDRIFYRKFLNEHFEGCEYYVEKRPSTVDMIVQAMKTAELNICMRFHSVLFAHTLETNFYAVDYTRGGKIKAYLKDNGRLDRMYSLEHIVNSPVFSFSNIEHNL